jgi:DNA-binding CsgD family transcriptional regulator
MRPLTRRDREVLLLLGEGLTRKQIGDRLGLTEAGASSRCSRLFRHLGAVNRAHAVYIAYEAGLLEEPDPARHEPPVVVRVPHDSPEVIEARRRVLLGEEST